MTETSAGTTASVVVGVGASAGGLDALSTLFEALPAGTGMAFLVLQHLDPTHPSLLAHLLSAKAAMPVIEATDGVRVLAGHVYVAPSGVEMRMEGMRLGFTPREPKDGPHLPIDALLGSLAVELGERAIGVILSGSGHDGSRGLAAIKSEGGITFAQDPASAEYPSMPESAISANVVDLVLPPAEIAGELVRLGDRNERTGLGVREPRLHEAEEEAVLDEVFALLRRAFQVDFSGYKLSTIRRRLARRMVVTGIDSMDKYVRLLMEDVGEVAALYRDLLIIVTEFFREPEAFAILRERVFPAILERGGGDAGVRMWVPGCATGEEVYSLLISLLEVVRELGVDAPVKVFATDISARELEVARCGRYPDSIASTVAPELLARYFDRTDAGYQVGKPVRELCVFARHDLTRDPPFAGLDLVSCRNVLIYFGPALQQRVIANLHYGLRNEGYLMLGRSESIAGLTDSFETVDARNRVFKKIAPGPSAALIRFSTVMPDTSVRGPCETLATRSGFSRRRLTLQEEADRAFLAAFALPGVTINSQHLVVEFRGDTSPYLKNRPGKPSLSLLDLVYDELAGKVLAALAEADRSRANVVFRGVRVGAGDARRVIDLHVIPFASAVREGHYLVLFEEVAQGARGGGKDRRSGEETGVTAEADRLRDELNATRELLEAVIQDKEAVNEELRAANEEMLSGGEEMQVVNEELTTSQGELQSANEELHRRNVELDIVSDDLSNLLASLSFPTIMVNRDLSIRRFTPAAERLLQLVDSDVGRPITDLRLHMSVSEFDLEVLLRETVNAPMTRERDVQDSQGRWYSMQLRPYMTADNRVDGAVVTLIDIDELMRRYATQARIVEILQQNFVHSLPQVPDLELGVVAETAFHRDLVGGDFHDVFHLPNGIVLALIGDVEGKGLEAAGLAGTVRGAVRAMALVSPSPATILTNVHRIVACETVECVTALVVLIEPTTGEVVLASAGHPPPVLLSSAGAALKEPCYGLPLGACTAEYSDLRFHMARGDTLVLYTDGVTEARRDGEQFGDDRLIDVLRGQEQRSPQLLAEALRDAVLEFGGELKDDLEILVVRRV